MLGLVVFDIAGEAGEDILPCCAQLQEADVELRKKNGTAGLGLALSVQETTPQHISCKRVGYVQFTAAFGMVSHRRHLRLT